MGQGCENATKRKLIVNGNSACILVVLCTYNSFPVPYLLGADAEGKNVQKKHGMRIIKSLMMAVGWVKKYGWVVGKWLIDGWRPQDVPYPTQHLKGQCPKLWGIKIQGEYSWIINQKSQSQLLFYMWGTSMQGMGQEGGPTNHIYWKSWKLYSQLEIKEIKWKTFSHALVN